MCGFCKKLLVVWRSKKTFLEAGEGGRALALTRAPWTASGFATTTVFCPRLPPKKCLQVKTSELRQPPGIALENLSTVSGDWFSPFLFNTPER